MSTVHEIQSWTIHVCDEHGSTGDPDVHRGAGCTVRTIEVVEKAELDALIGVTASLVDLLPEHLKSEVVAAMKERLAR